MGEEREQLMMPAQNRAKVASQYAIAIAWWGLDEAEKDREASGWIRGLVRRQLEKAHKIATKKSKRRCPRPA